MHLTLVCEDLPFCKLLNIFAIVSSSEGMVEVVIFVNTGGYVLFNVILAYEGITMGVIAVVVEEGDDVVVVISVVVDVIINIFSEIMDDE